MIISCGNCGTKFYVQENEIGQDGRFVRCAICEHEWLCSPEHNNPLVHSTKPHHYNKYSRLNINLVHKIKLLTAFFFICLTAIIILFPHFKENIAHLLHIKHGQKNLLVIAGVKYNIETIPLGAKGNLKKVLAITISVYNQSQQRTEPLTEIKIVGLDKRMARIMDVVVTPHTTVQPGATSEITVKMPIYQLMPNYIVILLNNTSYSSAEDLKSNSMITIEQ